MKKVWLLFLGMVMVQLSFAQELATLSGRVFDAEKNESLPYATVLLMNETGADTLAGTLSLADGRFILNGIAPGNYLIRCSFVGFSNLDKEVLVGTLNQVYDLGKLLLPPASQEIDQVVIAARREIVSADLDKMSYLIADDPSHSGGTMLDAMRGLPGISVTQDGKVMLRGSDKVAVLIDGKQSSLTGFGNQKSLDGIPAAQIERIEVLNNPSAKYVSSGMAGIINIIYKKENQEGLHGELGFTYGLGALGKRKADLPTSLGSFSMNPKYIPSVGLNYRNEKLRVFMQTEVLNQRGLPNNEFTRRDYDLGSSIISQVPENRKQTHYLVNMGVDWFINEKNSIQVSGIFDYESHIDSAQVAYIDLASMQRNRLYWWKEFEITGFMNYQLAYRHLFDEPGHTLNASLQYSRGWEDEEYQAKDSSAFRQSVDTTHIIAIEHTTAFNLDYVKPLKSGRLEAGSKIQIRRLPVDYSIGRGYSSIIYPGLGDWTFWGENLYAGYLNYIFERKHFELEGGLRLEQTAVFYDMPAENIYYDENDQYDYFGLFPNVRATWKISEKHGLSAFYNRRVDRPGEPELRIYPKSDDPELMKVGNPYLRPQFSQRMELAYKLNWSSGSLFVAGYRRVIDDTYMRIYLTDTTQANYDIVNKMYQNVGRSTHTGTEIVFAQQLKENWKMNASLNLYYLDIDAYQGEALFPYPRTFSIPHTQSFSWDAKMSSQVKAFGDKQFQVSFVYYAPQLIPQGKQLARYSLDFGFVMPVLSQKGELSFSGMDVFNRFGIRQEVYGDGFVAEYQNFYETQVIRVGFKYRF